MLCCWVFHFYYVDRDQKKTNCKFLKLKISKIKRFTMASGFRLCHVSAIVTESRPVNDTLIQLHPIS